MKTPIPLPSAILQEDSLIRHLLANERTIMRPFPDSLEQRYWNTLQERSASMIRNVYFTFMLVYLALGFITFPTVYFVSEPVNRAHDLFLWLLAYTNGIICLGVLPIMAHMPKLLRHYNRVLPVLAFLGVLGTCLFTMLFHQPQLAQQLVPRPLRVLGPHGRQEQHAAEGLGARRGVHHAQPDGRAADLGVPAARVRVLGPRARRHDAPRRDGPQQRNGQVLQRLGAGAGHLRGHHGPA